MEPALQEMAALARISSHVHSFVIVPFSKTVTSKSSAGEPSPSVSVTIVSPCLTSLSCPFLDCFPLSVIGSLKTSRGLPSTTASQHLKAHFCVSRFIFCSSAPPEPNATLAAAQPLSIIACKMTGMVSYETPSPWIRRIVGGNSLWPVSVVVVPNFSPRISSSSHTITGGSPESGRTTSRPSRFLMRSISSVPQRFLQAL
mmetsp:Transcript_75137/g.125270  ORF Transcript_75137/g.125270 Transcript_75137/m.125270 type:complete len:200 (+) Transcript_75137:420-1019(+)